MKRGFKDIEHKKYTAPQTARRKVDGKWSYTKVGKRLRAFTQRVRIRIASSFASRYMPYATEIEKTYVDHDRLVTKLITEGEAKPSNMAKRKFFVHRPKPANNQEKNRARRHSHVLKLGAATPGNKPEPAIRINAAQVRANQAVLVGMDPRAIRSITRDGRHRNRGDSVAQHRRKARKAARRAKHKRAA